MAKNTWRELLPCKECYRVVKNKHRLTEDDRLEIEVYVEDLDKDNPTEVRPYHVFKLTMKHVIRPGAQRNRQLYPLLSEKSLKRCDEIMEQNTKEYHRNIWLSNNKSNLSGQDFDELYEADLHEDNPKILVWKKNKKKEFKDYYNNLQHKDLAHGKSCHVDFYLSENDSRGLIAKINRGEKFSFLIDKDRGEKNYLDELMDYHDDRAKRQDVFIRTFAVKFYSANKLILRLTGGVYFVEVGNHLSLDSLSESGIELPSHAFGGHHV